MTPKTPCEAVMLTALEKIRLTNAYNYQTTPTIAAQAIAACEEVVKTHSDPNTRDIVLELLEIHLILNDSNRIATISQSSLSVQYHVDVLKALCQSLELIDEKILKLIKDVV